MNSKIISVPSEVSDILQPDRIGDGIARGKTRLVPLVPVGNDQVLPCIWQSHYEVDVDLPDGSKGRGRECLLLVSRRPLMTLRAEVVNEALKNFGQGPVEW